MHVLAHDEMPVRCSGCAFTEGTEANRDQLTTMTAELCLQAEQPFFCHANAIADKLPKGQERVCRGFCEERDRRPPSPAWKRAIADEALRIMEEEHDGIHIEPDEAQNRLLMAGYVAGRMSKEAR